MKYIALYEINLIINPVVETSPFLYCIIHWKGSFIQDYEFYYYYHLNLRILMLHIFSEDEVTVCRQFSWTPVQKPIFETFPSSRQNIFDNHLQRLIWDEWYFSKPNKSTTVFIILFS